MSFDLNLATPCNHLVYRELSPIGTDRKTLKMLKPVAITATIQVFATDNLIPASMYEIRNNVADNQEKVIVFRKLWRSPSDYFEVNYQTVSSYCSKCSGSKYLDDIQWDIRGNLQVLRDERLLMQNVEKWVITRINSNPFHTFIGNGLVDLIGTKINNVLFISGQIKTEITRSLQKFQDMQAQYKQTGRAITDGETLQSIQNVTVRQDANDPTVMQADVTVTAASGKTVEFSQLIRMRS